MKRLHLWKGLTLPLWKAKPPGWRPGPFAGSLPTPIPKPGQEPRRVFLKPAQSDSQRHPRPVASGSRRQLKPDGPIRLPGSDSAALLAREPEAGRSRDAQGPSPPRSAARARNGSPLPPGADPRHLSLSLSAWDSRRLWVLGEGQEQARGATHTSCRRSCRGIPSSRNSR